ncbi:ornithine decarboxylase 2-like [Arctopsyche grandis]|uniref:ornithine decarboxylase 2-like n=1 Tax=Arctopsyche grandis TaxID=121162 RepID=UPI00406D6A9E
MAESVFVGSEEWSPEHLARYIIGNRLSDRTFTMLNVADLMAKYKNWQEKMPRVEPFYAVKCNTNRLVLLVLASLGAGFDCASESEIDAALATGVSPDRIVYAHTAKPHKHLEYAREKRVKLLTFDSEFELVKVKHYYPDARLILRIRNDALIATCPLGQKYGCCPFTEAPDLLRAAGRLNLNVVGISFHVGSGCHDNTAHARGIAEARRLFNLGHQIGHEMNLLDIGGGFAGDVGTSIDDVAVQINTALDEHFPRGCNTRIISEPGRYFVASAFTLACSVHSARRVRQLDDKMHTMYFMDNGRYASFAGLAVNRLIINPMPLDVEESPLIESSLWGPTCDGIDVVVKSMLLPRLSLPSWILFDSFGAYTTTTSTKFNGFGEPDEYVFMTGNTRDSLNGLDLFRKSRKTFTELPDELPKPLTQSGPNVKHLYESPGKCRSKEWQGRIQQLKKFTDNFYDEGSASRFSPNKIRSP